jgi:hypothetical protein
LQPLYNLITRVSFFYECIISCFLECFCTTNSQSPKHLPVLISVDKKNSQLAAHSRLCLKRRHVENHHPLNTLPLPLSPTICHGDERADRTISRRAGSIPMEGAATAAAAVRTPRRVVRRARAGVGVAEAAPPGAGAGPPRHGVPPPGRRPLTGSTRRRRRRPCRWAATTSCPGSFRCSTTP